MSDPAAEDPQPLAGQAACLSPDDALSFCDEGVTVSPGLRAHVEQCARCRLLVAEAARAVVDVASTRSRALLTLSEGEQVAGRYRILRFLARGGMGEVYEAFDQVLQENVALKTLISTALDDDRAVSRLALEVRLARKVTHPNVCRILEFGFHSPASWKGARLPFLTMELLSGETLGKRLARVGPMPPAEVAALAEQMVAGLGAIHAAGIIHRDFKSDNAFLARSPGGLERVVLMDFGLARLPLDTEGRMQSTGSLIAGTADYIAPEQLQGGAVTPAADVYALGVVLFELLTGRRPFTGDTPVATAMNRLRLPPPAPSSRRPDLPRAWDEVVLGCLQRQPDRRFSRVEEVLTPLGPNAPRPRFSRSARLQPRRLALWALPALALAALAVVWVGPGLRGTEQPGEDRAPAQPGLAAGAASSTGAPAPPRLPPLDVPAVIPPAMLGKRWPSREIPVCVQGTGTLHDPEARVFEMFAHLDFTFNELGDFWLEDKGRCPPDPRGMIAVTLGEGTHVRADLGFHPDRPVQVHLGVDTVGYYDRTVHAFGRALGMGLRGDRVLNPQEITLVQTHYGRKPPGSLLASWGRCLARQAGRKYAVLRRCTGASDETWQRPVGVQQLHSAAGDHACLAVPERRKGRQPVTVTDCEGSPRDTISLAGATWRTMGDSCVTAADNRPGSGLVVTPCHDGKLQRWDFLEGNELIRLHGSDLCVTAPPGVVELGVGTRLSLERCGRSAGSQKLILARGGLIKVDLSSDLCLHASLTQPATGEITLDTWCDRKPEPPATRFHLGATLKVMGGCLSVQGRHNDDTPVWALPCVGGWRHQMFEYHW